MRFNEVFGNVKKKEKAKSFLKNVASDLPQNHGEKLFGPLCQLTMMYMSLNRLCSVNSFVLLHEKSLTL